MRIKAMLRFQNAQRQSLGGVICKNRYDGLCHDGAFIHLGPDKMYGAAADFAPCRKDALVRV